MARKRAMKWNMAIHLQEMNIQGILYFTYGFKRKILTPF